MMSGNSIFGKGVLGALAVALAATTIPSAAFAQQERREERGGRSWGGGEGRRDGAQRSDTQRGSGDFRARGPAQAQVQTPRAQQPRMQTPQQQRPVWNGSAPTRTERPANPGWQGRGNAENAPRWNAQQDRGTVNRPTTATPQRGWDGTRWNPTNPARQPDRNDRRDWNRDRDDDKNRGDRNWSNNRDRSPSWNGRNPGYSDRDRNRDYRRDDNRNDRNGWSNRDGWRSNDRNHDRRWSNNWRNDRRYDWNSYRSSNRYHYRMPRYYAPYRGYNYSRLSIGIFLNSGFYGNNYWINDPWSYRLPPAYGGYRWIRYYNDVLLVDTYTGEVADVIYNFFW